MAYRWDVFISYPHVAGRWVERFHADLERYLRLNVDPDIRIWRDEYELRVGTEVDEGLRSVLRDSAILIPVISAAWRGSRWCQAELEAFVAGGDVKGRVIAVETAPVEDLPSAVEEVLRQPFYGGRLHLEFEPATKSYKTAIARVGLAIKGVLGKVAQSVTQDLDGLVKELRVQITVEISGQCGAIKVLTMSQPIELGGIYTDVNIQVKVTGRQRKTLEELAGCVDVAALDRFGIEAGQVKRVPGLQAVEQHPKLMIYGKPGAGKTTFLRRLAMECFSGRFRPELVPAFVQLRELADAKGEPEIAEFIAREWKVGEKAEAILRGGRGLVLLDGLDEVGDGKFDRVRKSIDKFCKDYAACPVVITCRIAAREYLFEQFADVEMADFDAKQIGQFARNWFTAKGSPEKGDLFVEKLKKNRPIQELASSPLLCTLLCLVFEDRADFDGDRAELYREGFEVLLKTWDETRSIERDRPYRRLTAVKREDLLSHIAYEGFQGGEYLFRQERLEGSIREFFESRDKLLERGEELEPGRVLQAIEAQHGLLVARARRVYSFSHLTFQEYLTARQIVQRPELMAKLGGQLYESRWREVFLLVVGMTPADGVLPRWKQQIDEDVASDEEIQKFLAWAQSKKRRTQSGYKGTAVRAFYAWLNGSHDVDGALKLARALDLDPSRGRADDLARDLDLDLKLNVALDRARDLTREIERVPDLIFVGQEKPALALAFDLSLALDRVLAAALHRANTDLAEHLKQLKQSASKNASVAARWRSNGRKWAADLRGVMIRYRDIGHEWKFEPRQVKMLERYFAANLLLVDCMNAARDLKKSTREWIESTMLLPMESIKKMEAERARAASAS